MSEMIIDGRRVPIEGERNVLEVARKAGIELPTFCYHSELSVYGACRMCLVETSDGKVVASCSTPPQEGMAIKTNTERLRRIRKMALELLLANHDRDCTTCEKSGSCKLQALADRFGVSQVRFGHREKTLPRDLSSPSLVRDPNKCILCGDCVRVCSEIQGIGVLDFAYRGADIIVAPAFNKNMAEVDCVNCGQCASVCPTGALTIKSAISEVWDALNDPEMTVMVQVAPAVRVAIGERFGKAPGELLMGQLVAALRRLGFDKVFDTSFAADLTVVEETTEFLQRLESGERLPQFTSCCPAWVKYVEQSHPELIDNLSSCRSPQQMFGSLVKSYYEEKFHIPKEKIFMVSIMPCTAKKFEAERPEFATDGIRDVDAVLSTEELARMIKEAGIIFHELDIESLDMPFGFATGAGVIFGVTGGVSEAVLRAAHHRITGEHSIPKFDEVRGMDGVKEATISIGDHQVKLAVVHTLSATKELLERIKDGSVQYHIVEVMACPGGCIGGGGQPGPSDMKKRTDRAKGLYSADKLLQLHTSDENPLIQKVYEEFLGEEGGHLAHSLLHTNYGSRRRIQGKEIDLTEEGAATKLEVSVCVGTNCYLKGSYDILRDLSNRITHEGLEDKVDLKATFCMEQCGKGPTVRVGQEVYNGVVPDKIDDIFQKIKQEL